MSPSRSSIASRAPVEAPEGTAARPETPEYVRWLAEEIPFYKPRHFTKPGITGWAQVCAGYAASVDDTRDKLSYDLYYLRNRSGKSARIKEKLDFHKKKG